MAPASRTVVFLAFSLLLRAQAPAPEVAIRTFPYTPPSLTLFAETNLVEADLTVRDADGNTVAGLQASDFRLFDNSVPQSITAFSEVREDAAAGATPVPPRFVTFFFDDLHMGMPGPGSQFSLPFVKQAARDFAAKHLKKGDRMAIATTTGAGDLDFTDDAHLFAEKTNRLTNRATVFLSPSAYHQDCVNTLAALRAAAEKLSRMPGSRILVFLSSGFIIHIEIDHVVYDVEPELHSVIDAAVHGNISVQVIDAKGLSPQPSRGVATSRRPLFEIAEGTGGHLFENSNDLAGTMELAAHPKVTYLLAFNPGPRDGKFHSLKIKFTAKRHDRELEFRPEYLSRKDNDAGTRLAARQPFDAAVFSNETLSGIPAAVSLAGGTPKDGAIPVSIGITVDVNRVPFVTSHGRHVQQIAILMALLDSNGNFVTGKESILDLALTGERLASLEKTGLKTAATLTAPAGIYQVRTIVREAVKGQLAASTEAVQLRAN
jgi:VWFA-related protein